MAKKKATPERYVIFAKNYVITHNGTRSAIAAGYSEKTAYSQANRLLRNVEVKRLIKEAESELSKRFEITQDRVLKELANVAFSDATDYVNIALGKNGVPYVEFTGTKAMDKDKKAAISEIGQGKYGPYIKLHNKMQALDKLGEHLGIFGGKSEDIEDLDDELKRVFGDVDKE